QLTAASGALPTVTSAAFTVSPAAPASLAFTVQPSPALVNATIAPAVKVAVADAFGNSTPGASVALVLVGTGVLTGGGAVLADAAGVATFAALGVDRAGTFQVNATTGLVGPVASIAFTISCPAITVLPSSLPIGRLGTAYSHTITATGARPPYTFAVTAGALPPGTTLASTGLLSGFPTTAGVFAFTITGTSPGTGSCTGATAYSINVPVLPAAVTNLAATRLTAGNDASGIA